MKYIYYKDDFKVKLEFKDGDTPTPLDNVDFRGKLYTAYDKYSEGIPFSRIKGDVIGCDIGEDGSLTIVADNHGFRAGKLMVDMKYYIYDNEYADGTQTIARTYDLKTWLTTSQKLADGDRPIEVNAVINLPLEVIVEQLKTLTSQAEEVVGKADTAIANVETAIERANTAAESVEGAVESANAAANEARSAAESVSVVVEDATTATQRANSAADNVTAVIESANTATTNANSAAEQARTAASAASTAAEQATTAAQAANTAADNANTAADSASEYVERYDAIAGALPKVTDTFEGAAQDTGLRYVIRKNKLIAILKDGHVEYAPEGIAFVDAIEPTSFSIGTTTYNVPQGISYVELGLTTPITTELYQKGIYNVSGIRGFGLYLDGSKNTSLGLTFSSSADLEWLDLSGLDTSAVTYGYAGANLNPKLTTIIGKLSFPKADRVDFFFQMNKMLTSVDVSEMGLGLCRETRFMFNGCSSLTALDVSGWDTAAVTNMSSMFNGCSSLTALDVSGWDFSKCTTTYRFVFGCKSLSGLKLGGVSNPLLTDIRGMFSRCNLKLLAVNDFDVSAVVKMGSVFSSLPNILEIIIPKWNTQSAENMSELFGYCTNLQKVDISGFTMSNVTNCSIMFYMCDSLHTLFFPNMGQLKADSNNNKAISFSRSPLGTAGEESRQALIDLFSYDRTAKGLTNTLTVQLSAASKALLTAEEIAAITAKGYTIA